MIPPGIGSSSGSEPVSLTLSHWLNLQIIFVTVLCTEYALCPTASPSDLHLTEILSIKMLEYVYLLHRVYKKYLSIYAFQKTFILFYNILTRGRELDGFCEGMPSSPCTDIHSSFSAHSAVTRYLGMVKEIDRGF